MVVMAADAETSAVSDTASSFGGLEQMLPFRGGLTPEELAARQQRRLEQQRRQTKINAAGARAKTQMAERGALDQERRNSLFDADDFKASFEAKEASMQRTYRELYKPKANAYWTSTAAPCRAAAPRRTTCRRTPTRCRRRSASTPRSRRRSPPRWAPTRRAIRRRRASPPPPPRSSTRWRRRSPSTASSRRESARCATSSTRSRRRAAASSSRASGRRRSRAPPPADEEPPEAEDEAVPSWMLTSHELPMWDDDVASLPPPA